MKILGIRTASLLYSAKLVMASRLILLVVSLSVLLFSINLANPNKPQSIHINDFKQINLRQVVTKWDGKWYESIAENGYSPAKNPENQVNYVFFPLFPFMARLAGAIIGDVVWGGILVNLLATIVAGALLLELCAQEGMKPATAKRAVRYLLFFPVTFYFSLFLGEALFLCLLLAAWLAAKRERWEIVGLLGAPLVLSRPLGVLMAIPLFIEYLSQRNWKLRILDPGLLWGVGFVGGTLIWLLINQRVGGSPFAFMNAERIGWGRTTNLPWQTILHSFRDEQALLGLWAIAGFGLVAWGWRELSWGYRLTCLLFLVIPLSSTLIFGVPRYLVGCFPFYIILAQKFAKQEYDAAFSAAAGAGLIFCLTLWLLGSGLFQ